MFQIDNQEEFSLNKRKYSQISLDTRERFIQRVLTKEVTIKQVKI